MRPLRILKICNLVMDEMIRVFYRQRPEIKELSYQEHKQKLIEFAPVHLNGFSQCMRDLGHECDEVIYDLYSLQHQWAEENDASVADFGDWRLNILLQQIEKYRPDVIYMQDVYSMPIYIRQRIRDLVPSLKKVAIYKGFPGRAKELADVDIMFSGTPSIHQSHQDSGIRSELVYHSFDPKILDYLETRWGEDIQRIHPFVFVGYSGFGGLGSMHVNRYRMLRQLIDRTDLMAWVTEHADQRNPALNPDELPLRLVYPARCLMSCFGLDMHYLLKSSKVVFNKHTEAVTNEVGNMRLFEASGLGTCLLTDTGANMSELFEADKEIVTYSSIEECIEKANYLRENDDVRKQIAAAGQQRTLREHNLANRCQIVSEALQSLFD